LLARRARGLALGTLAISGLIGLGCAVRPAATAVGGGAPASAGTPKSSSSAPDSSARRPKPSAAAPESSSAGPPRSPVETGPSATAPESPGAAPAPSAGAPGSPAVRPPVSGSRAAPEEPEGPWVIEGESLSGSRAGGTEIVKPRVTHGTLTITGLNGRLSADRDEATFVGDVRIADSSRVTTADEGTYRRSTRVLDLSGNVRGHGPEGSFEAGSLTWDRAAGHQTLREHPRLQEVGRVLWADRTEYDTVNRSGQALGHVKILMLPDSTWAYGERADYDDRSAKTVLLGNPRLTRPGTSGEPATVVTADTLILDQTTRTGEALGSVRIVREEMRTRSRRALFVLDEDRIVLHGDPVAWDSEGEIRADTMTVRIRRREADQMRAFGRVRVRFQPRDKRGEEDILLGDTLVAGLTGGAVTDMEVQGHALSIYAPAFADVQSGTGRNLCRARTVHIYLLRGEANRVDLIQQASGSYLYPSEAAREKVRSPAALDSLQRSGESVRSSAARDTAAAADDTTAAALGAASAARDTTAAADSLRANGPPPGGEPAPPGEPAFEAPPLRGWQETFVRNGTVESPDSLSAPYDRLFSERVDYEGDSIRFYVPQERIQIVSNGVLKYQGSELKAHEINYQATRRLVTAEGTPSLSDPQNTVVGVKMTYRTDEREGMVYQGRTEFDNGFYRGKEIKKLSDQELLVRQGDYTTCNKDSVPDYHFHADRMKVILKDKVVARPVVFYIKHIPVLALPYYIFPIRKGRHSGIMMPDVEFGISRDKGRFARNLGYYWAISDYMDARSWIDYYDVGPKIYLNGDYQYRVRYVLNGSLEGSYLRESVRETGSRSIRWSVQGDHTQTLGEGAQLTMREDFTSDKDFRGDRDFGAGVDERLNRTLKSDMNLRKNWSRTSLNLSASRTQYLDATTGGGIKISQAVPSLDFNVNSGTIGRAPDAAGRGARLPFLSSTYAGTAFKYRNAYTRRFDGRIGSNQAVEQDVSLSDNRSLGPFLRFQPSWSGSWAGFARDNRGEHIRAGYSWGASARVNNTIYGNFLFPFGPLLGLRHVIEPSATYNYHPELKALTYADPSDSTGRRRLARFPNVGGIGLSGSRGSSMSFSLNQRFHAKWKRGDKVIKKENVFTWSTSTGVDFLAKPPRRKLSTVSNSFQLRPFSTLESSASVTHNPYGWGPQSFSINSAFRISSSQFRHGPADTTQTGGLQYGDFGESQLQGADLGNKQSPAPATNAPAPAVAGIPWNLSFSHAYSTSRGSARPSNTLNASLTLTPTTNWKFDGSLYMDLRLRKVISHSFVLYRDLHCWELRFEHRTSGSQSQYYFHIGIKQIPDVKYEKERR
jgi:lipopolysaccharide assembly outer membrane protein LptD (OstA)